MATSGVWRVCALAASLTTACAETVLIRSGENRSMRLIVDDSDGAAVSRFCYCGASHLNLALLWHRAELKFESHTDASYFEFEGHEAPTSLLNQAGITPMATWTVGQPLSEVRHLSPFGISCIGIRARHKLAGREGYVRVTAARHFIWWLPLLMLCGVACFRHASAWSEQESFYYVGGSALGVALGCVIATCFILNWLVNRSLSRRFSRAAAYVVLLSGCVRSLADVIANGARDLVWQHWRFCLGYASLCAAISLSLVHRGISRANGVPSWCRDVTRWSLAVGAVVLMLSSTYSSAHSYVGLGLAGVASLSYVIAPHSLQEAVWMKLFDTKAAPRPHKTFLASRSWLSQDQYDVQRQIETERALKELHQTPEFQKWLIANHHRMQIADR